MKKEWFTVPNLIGYIRLLLLAVFPFIENNLYQLIIILAAFFLDYFDGIIARVLKQSSVYGARLDLLLDMAGHLLLTLYVAYIIPSVLLKAVFILIAANDALAYSLSLLRFYGKKPLDHKKVLKNRGFFLRLYYTKLGLFIGWLQPCYFFHFIYQPSWWPDAFVTISLFALIFRQIAVLEQNLYLLKSAKVIDNTK